MAVVHVIIFLALNLISIENPEVFEAIMIYFVPFISATIILGVWAFQITIRMVIPYYANLNLIKKFFSFQLVLIFCKLQPVLLNLILKHVINSCEGPFTIPIKIRGESHSQTRTIHQFSYSFSAITQTVIEVEMFLLSLWAQSLYTS